MSVAGYMFLCKITLAAGAAGVIAMIILYRKLEIRKACSILYGFPIKKAKTVKNPVQADQSMKIQNTQVLPQKTDMGGTDTICLRPRSVTRYEQTFIHTNAVIEDI